MKRSQLKAKIKQHQRELREIEERLQCLTNQATPLQKRGETIITELRDYCDKLGQTWADTCPAFRASEKVSSCLIYSWEDRNRGAKGCINCPVSTDEARIRVLICKLVPRKEVQLEVL